MAVLRLYTTYVEKDTPVNIDGHVFLAVTNNTDADLAVGGLSIAPGTSITMGTRATTGSTPGCGITSKAIIRTISRIFMST